MRPSLFILGIFLTTLFFSSCKKDSDEGINPDYFQQYHFVLDGNRKPLFAIRTNGGKRDTLHQSFFENKIYENFDDTMYCDSVDCLFWEYRYFYDGTRLARSTKTLYRENHYGHRNISGPGNHTATYTYDHQNVILIKIVIDNANTNYHRHEFSDYTAAVNTNPLFNAIGHNLVSYSGKSGMAYRGSRPTRYRYEFDENSFVTRIYTSRGDERDPSITQIDFTYETR
ncbi:hypothetical protein KFE98_09365 [bacterium SCSIO 12741]|nr:hypothetical protein KFE98_09365 [bacterium SCSIO 12741]